MTRCIELHLGLGRQDEFPILAVFDRKHPEMDGTWQLVPEERAHPLTGVRPICNLGTVSIVLFLWWTLPSSSIAVFLLGGLVDSQGLERLETWCIRLHVLCLCECKDRLTLPPFSSEKARLWPGC